MYNAMYPSVPPDIVFGTEEEGFNPLLVIAGGGRNGEERKSCLRSWNGKDQSKLLDLVNEFRELYVEYHRKRAGELDDERLKFETDTISSRWEWLGDCIGYVTTIRRRQALIDPEQRKLRVQRRLERHLQEIPNERERVWIMGFALQIEREKENVEL